MYDYILLGKWIRDMQIPLDKTVTPKISVGGNKQVIGGNQKWIN